MASYEPMNRMSENAFRGPGKTQTLQSKVGRKALGDLTNSTKTQPQTKSKAPSKNVEGGLNIRGNVQPKIARKPLGDLTNSIKPHTKAKTPKKKNGSKVQIHGDFVHEGFCHNHQECVKVKNQCMSTEHFLETVGLQKASISVATPKLKAAFTSSAFEVESPSKYLDDIDIKTSKNCGKTPVAKSPTWDMDLKDLEFSGFKLIGEFSGFKLKESKC